MLSVAAPAAGYFAALLKDRVYDAAGNGTRSTR
jgi:hypothetical protein